VRRRSAIKRQGLGEYAETVQAVIADLEVIQKGAADVSGILASISIEHFPLKHETF